MEFAGLVVVCLFTAVALWRLEAGWVGAGSALALAVAVTALAASYGEVQESRDLRSAADAARLPHPRPSADGFAGSGSCRACHPDQYASWYASFHRTMTQPANRETVVAAFDGQWLDGPGGRFRPLRRGDDFWVATSSDPAAPLRRVLMTTGSHHQQRFWLQGDRENGLDLLPFSWLIAERRWVPDDAVFVMPPTIASGVAPRLWNANCLTCHSVAGIPGGDPRSPAVETRAAELGIACEACHGPAANHVAVNRNPLRRWRLEGADVPDPTIVNPRRLQPAAASAVCAQCHGVFHWRDGASWRREGPHFRPGDPSDGDREFITYDPDPPQPALRQVQPGMPSWMAQHFWPDGMVRISGREFSAMSASACARGGLSCLSCHTMHRGEADDQLIRGRESDGACAPCHADVVAAGMSHTHHAADQPGSACMDCHMPFTTLGLLKAIRSHQITRPSVATTLASGRPDACSLCHLDRPLAWSAQWLSTWWNVPVPSELEPTGVAAGVEWILKGDAAQRTLVAWHLGQPAVQVASGRRWAIPYLAGVLDDPYAAVRFSAGRSLGAILGESMPPYDFVGPEPARRAAADSVAGSWKDTDRSGDAVLIGASGGLEADRVAALRAQRDDRPVFIAE